MCWRSRRRATQKRKKTKIKYERHRSQIGIYSVRQPETLRPYSHLTHTHTAAWMKKTYDVLPFWKLFYIAFVCCYHLRAREKVFFFSFFSCVRSLAAFAWAHTRHTLISTSKNKYQLSSRRLLTFRVEFCRFKFIFYASPVNLWQRDENVYPDKLWCVIDIDTVAAEYRRTNDIEWECIDCQLLAATANWWWWWLLADVGRHSPNECQKTRSAIDSIRWWATAKF